MNLIDSWETQSPEWIGWAWQPGFDTWRYHRDQFLELLPSPDRRTVDVGCGEGRLTRHLKEIGHPIVGIDASPSLVAAAGPIYGHSDCRRHCAPVGRRRVQILWWLLCRFTAR